MQQVITNTDDPITGLTPKEWINAFLTTAISNGFAAACWSQPESTSWDLIADPQPLAYASQTLPLLHQLPSGFVLAPFHSNASTHYIQNRIHLRFDSETSWQVQAGYEYVKDAVQTIVSSSSGSLQELLNTQALTANEMPSMYTKGVQQAKEAIEQETLQKVVFARSADQALNTVAIEDALIGLRTSYPHACIAIYYHPETGLWITATPELLLSMNAAGTFKTVALAGTQQYDESIPMREVSWTHKEIEEQALVCRYIISCFKAIRLREYDEQGPRTIRAGSILHLKTEFIVDTHEVNMPELASTMLTLLHPTSAVCGMPKQPALDFIKDHEHFDRQLYSGFIGPVNMNGDTSLYVNLRCARIYSNKITLFAGAGITSDSVPEKEWEETSLKMNVIGHAFSNL